jgi:hypothetical protein
MIGPVEWQIPAGDVAARRARKFIVDQQLSDWNELYAAIGRAVNGHWSMECERLVDRIREAALLVGLTDWYEAPWPLFRQGIYPAIAFSVLGEKWEHLPQDVYENTNRLMERHMDPVMLERCLMAASYVQRHLERYAVPDPATSKGQGTPA